LLPIVLLIICSGTQKLISDAAKTVKLFSIQQIPLKILMIMPQFFMAKQ
jgi:hypothetical protein